MSFLSVAFLTALPLAAAPILLHLFDRRRNVVIEWGAMQFLVEAAARRANARKLKQWLLMMLRVCAVAALVLALSQPLLPGHWFTNGDRGETILVMDNSMSMTRRQDGRSLLDEAIDRATAALGDVAPGDSVRVLSASPYPIWETPGAVRMDGESADLIEKTLRGVRPTVGSSDLLAALFAAVQVEFDPAWKQRKIVLFTDAQAADWNLREQSGWRRFRQALQDAPIPTHLEVVELGSKPKAAYNVAVDSVRSSRTVVAADQPFTLTMQIHNHGPGSSPACSVVWKVGEQTHHESPTPALEEGAAYELSWKHSFAETGVYAVTCAVDVDDAVSLDNGSTVVVEVVDEIPIVLLEDSPQLAEMQQDAFFVQAALGWLDGQPLADRGAHRPLLVDSERLERMDLTGRRAVVVPNLTTLSDDVVRKLSDFVRQGGGLWIALGPRTDVDAFNRSLFADGDGLAPLAIQELVADVAAEGDGEDSRKPRIDPLLLDHPALAELADKERLDLGEVMVSQRFRFQPPADGKASVLLRLDNGDPFAVENSVGRGRVVVQAAPLRMQWSGLARSQAFVVLVRDWLSYLSQPLATRHNLAPGEPIALLLTDKRHRNAILRTPHGDQIELTADPQQDGVMFRTGRTVLPGDYTLELSLTGAQIPFHVQRPSQESDLSTLTTDDQQLLADLSGLGAAAGAEAIGGTNQTDPLWPLLLMALIVVIALELVLSGVIARERFGSDPIAETSPTWGEPPTSASASLLAIRKNGGTNQSQRRRPDVAPTP